jgi:hypothetical protein
MLISSLVLLFCVGLAWQSLAALVERRRKPPSRHRRRLGRRRRRCSSRKVFIQYARRQAERLGSRLLDGERHRSSR